MFAVVALALDIGSLVMLLQRMIRSAAKYVALDYIGEERAKSKTEYTRFVDGRQWSMKTLVGCAPAPRRLLALVAYRLSGSDSATVLQTGGWHGNHP